MSAELRSRLRQAHDDKADERDRRNIQPWKLEERLNFLALLIQERKRSLLEIGAGTGIDGKFFQDHGLEKVVCIDVSPEMVKLCQKKGMTSYVMDFGALEFPASSFDAVYALKCLLHLPKIELPSVLETIHMTL